MQGTIKNCVSYADVYGTDFLLGKPDHHQRVFRFLLWERGDDWWGREQQILGSHYITDDVIEQFGRLPHVSGVSPVLEINVVMRQGAYEAQYLSLVA